MNCKDAREQLFDLAAPGAGKAQDAAARHVAECTACAAELNSLRQTMALLDEWKAPEPSPYFDVRLQARLREAQAQPQTRGVFDLFKPGWVKTGWQQLRWQPVTAAALSFAIAVGVIVYQSGGPRPEPKASAAVADLQALDKNGEVYKNFDLLYDDEPQQQQQQGDENP